MDPLPLNQILCGDCLDVMQGFPENSIDLVVTDPPYGLSFMGKDWDKSLPPRAAFEEIRRVLKPGALCFVMSSPRQDLMWRMMRMLEEAGFEMNQSFISWVYKTGFPKAYDVSKGIDRIKKTEWDEFIELRNALIKNYEKSGVSRKTLSETMEVTLRQIDHWFKHDESQPQIPSLIRIDQLSKYMKIPTTFQTMLDYLNSINYKTKAITVKEIKAFRNNQGWASEVNSGIYTVGDKKYSVTKPFSSLAKQWQGYKSQTSLKPALEPVLMVNKPFSEKTIVDNVLRWGTGAINVDAARIPINKEDNIHAKNPHTVRKPENYEFHSRNFLNGAIPEEYRYDVPKGRFPANLLVSDGALDTGEITKSSGGANEGKLGVRVYGKFRSKLTVDTAGGLGDVGDQSRYFDLDRWAEHHGILDVPKPDASERDHGLKGSFILLESFMIDEAKCKDGNITLGERLARLQVDMGQYPPKVTVESGTKHKNGIAWSMMLFGKNIMEKYQKDFVFIIKTGTNSITKLKILNWLTFLFTNEYMVDVKRLTRSGGSHAQNVGNSNQLLITINEKTASALGVKNAASETRLIINVKEEKRRSTHPTVKPIKLMAFLIELGCPRDGVVLDPFVGSGTTCIAAKQLGRRYIGIEISEEYHRLAEARVSAYPQPLEWFTEDVQFSEESKDA